MFYTLHRAVKFLCLCAILGVGLKLYQHRAALEPALIWYDVWDNGGFQQSPIPTVGGRVERIVNSQTFVMTYRNTNRFMRYNVRLQGLRDPGTELSLENIALENTRRQALSNLIYKQWVHLELTYQNSDSLGGVAFARGTNINAELVRQGHARTSKELVKILSKESQYSLLWADRHRPK